MSKDPHELMESASQALVRMDYFACERLCLTALALAREARDWPTYARIMLPLQEARRQQRMTAVEGAIRLGSENLSGKPADWLTVFSQGCLVLTHPHTADDARSVYDLARRKNYYIQVLLTDSHVRDETWVLRSFQGPAVSCRFDAPPHPWRNCWLSTGRGLDDQADNFDPQFMGTKCDTTVNPSREPADWFINACQALGDAAMRRLDKQLTGSDRLVQLEKCLEVVTDHEIIHQTLGQTARALRT